MPHIIIIAGPNGAGKSTAAPALLPETLGITEFVNADAIARGLSAFAPERVAFRAGRIMLERLQQLAEERVNFAFETTLATRSFAPWIANLRSTGYLFHLVFLWLPNPDIAIARVQARVLQGGHDVPETTILRRYHAGLNNFWQLYRPLADTWRFYENVDSRSPRLIASGRGDFEQNISDNKIWESIAI
ncbi:MAG: zeta toxin family protein [Hormoscilla sp. GM102CHS1]|nr:zeta toxin family protein [Hormoscilla sp. GM102CHS1]